MSVFCDRTKCVRREASSSGDLNQIITRIEWKITEGNRAGCKLDIFELGEILERAMGDSVEFFVADDAFEQNWNAHLPIVLRLLPTTTRSREEQFENFLSSMTVSLSGRVTLVRAEQPPNACTPKFVMLLERCIWNALEFGTTGEVDSKEGGALAEGSLIPPPKGSEVGAPQIELNGAVEEALLILQPDI